jgi:hypothetical protein
MFGVASEGLLTFYIEDTSDEAMMKAYQAILRIDTALEGLVDLHCPQCGRRLGMTPHLCDTCAAPEGLHEDPEEDPTDALEFSDPHDIND